MCASILFVMTPVVASLLWLASAELPYDAQSFPAVMDGSIAHRVLIIVLVLV